MNLSFETAVAEHDPALYLSAGTVPSFSGWDAVDDDAYRFYDEQGFMVVANAFPREMVDAALAELEAMSRSDDPACAQVAFEGGLRSKLGVDADKASEDVLTSAFRSIAPEERARYIRKFMGFTREHPPLKAMSSYAPLKRVMERIVGDRTRLFQSMALIKPPGGREKPWHQDHAYFNYPIGTKIAGVWIALGKVTPDNGCMFVLPGAHRDGPVVHFKRRDWQICDTEILGRREVALPMEAGDLMIFDAKLPHGTPTNRTNTQRWAVQYHYVPASAANGTEEERLSIFGSEGKNVTC